MTLPMQTFVASKTEVAPDFRDRLSLEPSQYSYIPDIPSNTGSLYLDQMKGPDFWRIFQESWMIDRLKSNWPESISSTAAQVDTSATAGALLLRDIGIGIAGALNPELRDALRDLEETADEAHEEGFPVPSNSALEYARTILCAMYAISPRRYEVYPTPDGEVAIDAPGGFGRSVLLLCESDGGALCLVNMNGSHRRARYSDAKMLPDGFVREALAELDRRNDPAA